MGRRWQPGGMMLQALGRATYRARWASVVVWLLLFAVGSLFAPRIFSVLRGGGYTVGNSQSVVAYNKLSTAFGYKSLMFTAVFAGGTAPSRLADARTFRRESVARYGTVLTVGSPVTTPDGALVFERIYSQPQADFGASYATKLRALFPHDAVVGHLTGASAIYSDMESVSDQDLHGVELVTLPIAIIVLFLIFGSVMGALVPVLMAPVAVTISLAEIYFIGRRVDMSIFVFNTASMLGLGVAIDYSLFMVNRFREELRNGGDRETAVANTVATSGRAILVSALVVSVGFYGLTFSGVSMLSSLGIGGSIVTLMSLLVALPLLPALLGILGPRIEHVQLVAERLSPGRAWHHIAMAVMRRPWTVIAVVAAIVVILASPAFHLRPGIPGPQIFPPSVDSRAGNDLLASHLGTAAGSPVMVTVERLPARRPERSARPRSPCSPVLARLRSWQGSPRFLSPTRRARSRAARLRFSKCRGQGKATFAGPGAGGETPRRAALHLPERRPVERAGRELRDIAARRTADPGLPPVHRWADRRSDGLRQLSVLAFPVRRAVRHRRDLRGPGDRLPLAAAPAQGHPDERLFDPRGVRRSGMGVSGRPPGQRARVHTCRQCGLHRAAAALLCAVRSEHRLRSCC